MLGSATVAPESLADRLQIEQLLEWRMLKALGESDGALGSVRLQAMLLKQGYTLSQTTVGRLLNRLDLLGYTTVDGPKQGRRLTELGERRLRELATALASQEHERQLLEAMRVRSVPDILDALRVRAAIEGQAARLTAERATRAQVEELRAILARSGELLRQGEHPLEPNRLFHLKIAEHSGSRMLHSVLRFLLRDPQRLRLPPEIELYNLSTSQVEHEQILAAIAARDSAAAEQRMVAHHRRTESLLEDYIMRSPPFEVEAPRLFDDSPGQRPIALDANEG